MSTAAEHAIIASELLVSLDRLTTQLRDVSAEQELAMMAAGTTEGINAAVEHMIKLSVAHSLAAIAMTMKETEE